MPLESEKIQFRIPNQKLTGANSGVEYRIIPGWMKFPFGSPPIFSGATVDGSEIRLTTWDVKKIREKKQLP